MSPKDWLDTILPENFKERYLTRLLHSLILVALLVIATGQTIEVPDDSATLIRLLVTILGLYSLTLAVIALPIVAIGFLIGRPSKNKTDESEAALIGRRFVNLLATATTWYVFSFWSKERNQTLSLVGLGILLFILVIGERPKEDERSEELAEKRTRDT